MRRPLLIEEVRDEIGRSLVDGYPTVGRVAGGLEVSPRTLQRHLARSGVSYGQLVDAVRCERACRLLSKSTMKHYQIASTLGFADASSFSRFFRRRTGVSPSEYRRGMDRR